MQATIIDTPPIAPSAASEPDAPCYGVAFNLEFDYVLMFSDYKSPLANLLKADMERALTEAGLLLPTMPDPASPGKMKNGHLVFAQFNWISGVFIVSDWFAALSIMEAELHRTGLFAQAETGWRDNDDQTWRRHSPQPAGGIFQPLLLVAFEQPLLTPKLRDTMQLFLKLFALANLMCSNPAIAPQIIAAVRTALPPPSGDPKP